MSGTCETCKNAETCKKAIGMMFGFCKTDYIPKREKEEKGKKKK